MASACDARDAVMSGFMAGKDPRPCLSVFFRLLISNQWMTCEEDVPHVGLMFPASSFLVSSRLSIFFPSFSLDTRVSCLHPQKEMNCRLRRLLSLPDEAFDSIISFPPVCASAVCHLLHALIIAPFCLSDVFAVGVGCESERE